MRNIDFLVAILSFTIFSTGYSGDVVNGDNKSYGCQKYGKETVDNIYANGCVLMEGTTILNLVFVNGSLNADESTINRLEVNGQVDLKNCIVNNNSIVNGSLNADNTQFQKELSVSSQKVTLTSCSVDTLKVSKVNGYDGKQIVELRGTTKIVGPIIMESGKGEIWSCSECEILDRDQIHGAIIIKK